jgi:hypothetical protein
MSVLIKHKQKLTQIGKKSYFIFLAQKKILSCCSGITKLNLVSKNSGQTFLTSTVVNTCSIAENFLLGLLYKPLDAITTYDCVWNSSSFGCFLAMPEQFYSLS